MKKLFFIVVLITTNILCFAQNIPMQAAIQVQARVTSISIFKQSGLQPVSKNGTISYLKSQGTNTYWIVKSRILADNRPWAEVWIIKPPARVGQNIIVTLPIEYYSRYRNHRL